MLSTSLTLSIYASTCLPCPACKASEDDSSIGVACGHETSVDDTVTSVREPSVVVGEGEGQKVERRDTAARLMRSMEAARALGLSCGE